MHHIIKAILIPVVSAFVFPVFGQQFTEVAQQLGVADSVRLQGRGAQWVFVSNQERPDLYVSNSMFYINPWRPTPNRLYINRTATGAGFTERATEWNVAVGVGRSMAAGWADFDLDTDLDLYVTNGYGFFGAPSVPNQFYRNEGGIFTEVGAAVGVDSIDWNMNSVAWGDYNGDGRPDLYVSNKDGANLLFRNAPHFLEVAAQFGVRHEVFEGDGNGQWVDYDNDGDLDLFLPVFQFASHLYRNDLAQSGGFSEIASDVGLTITNDVYQCTWGDYDNDGDFDVYCAVGGKNLLYRNDYNDNGTFAETAEPLGIADSALTRQASWADYDNDGDVDLFVINYNAPDRLYRNDLNTSGHFTDVSMTAGLTHTNGSNFTTAWGDYDADGDLDLYIVNNDTTNWLYRNNQDDTNFLKVRFLSANGSFSRQGSVIEVYRASTDSLVGMRQVDGGSGKWGCQDMYDVHFGLDGTRAYDLVIRSTLHINGGPVVLDKGSRPELGGIVPMDVGGFVEVRDTLDTVVGTASEPAPLPQQVILQPAYPNPFNSTTTLHYTLPSPTWVTLRIVDLRGAVVRTLVRRRQPAGTYSVHWNGMDEQNAQVASGVYFVQLQSQTDFGQAVHRIRKLLLVK